MSENSPKQFYTNMFMDFAVRKQWGMDFVTEESFIIDYDLVLAKSDGLNLNLIKSYIIYNMLAEDSKVYYIQKCCINNKCIFCG